MKKGSANRQSWLRLKRLSLALFLGIGLITAVFGWLFNKNVPLVRAAALDWSVIGWNETIPNSQTFTNVDGTGVDITLDYSSDTMFDGVPNIYGGDAPVPPLQNSLRWTNNTADAGGAPGAPDGPTVMTVTFSTPVYLDDLTIGSLSELTNVAGNPDRYEWAVIQAFDTSGNLVLATSFTGTTHAIDDGDNYLGISTFAGRPEIIDNSNGVYQARGVSIQYRASVCTAGSDRCGYDRASFVYNTTPISYVEVRQIVTTGTDFSSPISSGLSSIVVEVISFRPANQSPPTNDGAIGNCIWLDEDANGRFDSGEPGIPNVLVNLTDSTGGISQTVTAADGCYLFDDLPADTYTVTLPASNQAPGGALDGLTQTANPTLPNADFGNQTLPYVINLADGEENLTADFGFNRNPGDVIANSNDGAIGDRVWVDLDEDGQQDPTELGIEDVTVRLIGPGPDNIFDTGDDVVLATDTTDPMGLYRFDNLPAGAYQVEVDPTTLPTGYAQTGDPDGDTDNQTTAPLVLSPGDVYLNADFGYSPNGQPVGRIGTKVWFDADASGTPEEVTPPAAEYGIAGVTVTLLKNETETTTCSPDDGTNPVLATAVTDENGMYLFEGLPLDDGDGDYDYIIWVNDTHAVLAGLTPTYDFDGEVTPNCSVTALDGTTVEDLDQDFSYTPDGHEMGEGLIGDTVWFNKNGDTVQDADEPGLEGVIVTLTDELSQTVETTTDENGRYFFGNLVPTATYTITIAPENFDPGGVLEDMVLNQDPDLTDDGESVTDLGVDGPINLDLDFGYAANPAALACIGNLVWLDPNADGRYDGANGPDGLPNTDDDEPAIADVTIELYRDLNGDGLINVNEPRFGLTTTVLTPTVNGCFSPTDLGNYLFDNIPADDYIVVVTDQNNVLEGYWHSRGADGLTDESQSNPYPLAVGINADNLTADFGYYVDGATLGNRVWRDLNADGLQDPGEPGLANTAVNLIITFPDTTTITLTTLTDNDGFYQFPNLLQDEAYNGDGIGPEPTFTVTVETPVGYQPSPTDVNSNADDLQDSDDPDGVAAQPVKGITDVSAQPDPTDEPTSAAYDFGFVIDNTPLAALGNYVWLDENADGRQDPGEPGIPNVTLILTDEAGGTTEQITGSDGGYLFPNLPAGIYTVTLDTGTLPVGLAQTSNPVQPNGDGGNQTLPYQVTLADGDENLTADFGFVWNPADVNGDDNNGMIGDRVWLDGNGDGTQDPTEPGIEGVTVRLIDPGPDDLFDTADDVTSATATTDDNGRYQFTNLPPGPYRVTVDPATLPAGVTQTGDPDYFGTTSLGDNDNQTTTPILLDPGDVFLNADFGYQPTVCGQIGDTVWFDANDSGTPSPDSGELGIPGVTVALIADSDGDGIWDSNEAVIATAITDQNGQYLFGCLSLDDGDGDADYLVWVNDTEHVLAGLRQTYDFDGLGTPNLSATALDAGTPSDLDQDFSYTPRQQLSGQGLIGDTIWLDQNSDGLQDATEPGIEGVELLLTDSNGVTQTTVTDENGRYAFAALDPTETYTVTVQGVNFAPNGVLEGLIQTGDPDATLDDETAVDLSGVPGGISLTADFGYTPAQESCIGNLVWLDSNVNGVFDPGETAIAGVTVDLYRDLNSNQQIDPNEPRVQTAVTTGTAVSTGCSIAGDLGNYLFTDLAAGSYLVTVSDRDGVLNGYWHTLGTAGVTNNSQSDPYALIVPIGSDNLTADFGYYLETAALGNFVFFDINGDGLQDPLEPGLPGARVTLTVVYSNTATVRLSQFTDGNGFYRFGNLLSDEDFTGAPGNPKPNFTISVDPPPGFGSTVIDVNTNGNDLEDADDPSGVTAVPVKGLTDVDPRPDPTNESVPASYDFGFISTSVQPSSLGNYVWLDENSDGLQDPGEVGIPNVTVNLFASNGALIDTVETDTDGGYLFTGLMADAYTVTVDTATLPAGLLQTTNPMLPNGDLGNQTAPYQIVLPAGTENLTADFGYVWNPTGVNNNTGLGAIGDTVWLDGDGDGRQSPEEPGLPGVQLNLVSAGADGLFGTLDDAILSNTTTDENGRYQFRNTPPGAYRVVVDPINFTAGRILEDLTQTADPDEFNQPATAPDNQTTMPIVLAPGDTFVNADFGYQPALCGQIGDTVWFDADASGTAVVDAGEYGIGGVTVALLQDANENGTRDAADYRIAVTTTAPDGTYLFPCLLLDDDGTDSDADYLVEVTDTNNVLAGLTQTYDEDGLASANVSPVTLSGIATSNLDQDFSYTPIGHSPGDGLIGDTVYWDIDGNGSQEPNEPGLEGVPVELTLPNGDTIVILTDENGRYAFGGLTLTETYTLTIGTTGTLAGFTNSADPDTPGAPDDRAIVTTLTFANPTDLDQDFGYTVTTPGDSVAIGNLVWRDSNGNGQFDGVDGPDGLPGTEDDEPPLADITVDLFRDLDGNGRLDPNEPLILTTTTTDTLQAGFNNGNYLFDGLPPGDYLVVVSDRNEVLLGNWSSSGATDVDNNSQQTPYAVSLTAGQTNTVADFGYFIIPAAAGNRTWEDEDGNGIQDIGEPALGGVTLTLRIEYQDSSVITLTTVSDGSGAYQFGNLMLDEDITEFINTPAYTISAVPPTGYVPTQSDQGGDQTDSDDPTGTAVTPLRGIIDMTVTADPATEPTSASTDFGFHSPLRIGNLIYIDLDDSGDFDIATDIVAPAGIVVELLDTAENPVLDLVSGLPITAVTDAGGNYALTGISAGNYIVRVSPDSFDAYDDPLYGFYSSQAQVMPDPAPDPDLDQTDQDDNGQNNLDPAANGIETAVFTLLPQVAPTGELGEGGSFPDDDSNFTIDFGFFELLTLGNRIWYDENSNGLYDAGTESGMGGVIVYLQDGSGNPVLHPVSGLPISATTGTDGIYQFTNLYPGEYRVFVAPENFQAGGALEGFVSTPGSNDPDDDADGDDNGVDTAVPAVDGVASLPVTLAFDLETVRNEDGDNNDNTNLTVDFGFVIVPNAIELDFFRTTPATDRQVLVEWGTISELDNFGFKIYRSEVNDPNTAVAVHFEPSAFSSGTGGGATYRYVDNVPGDGIYYYWLVDVSTIDGHEQWHIPATQTAIGNLHRQFIPLLLTP